MKRIIISILLLTAILSFSACKKSNKTKKTSKTPAAQTADSQTQSVQLENMINLWHVTNKRICVLFGYGYNDEETIEQLTQMMDQRYGLDEDDGLIFPLTYPDSFKHNGRSFSSEFYSILSESEKDFAGIVILGAPETTHIALSRLQDFWEMNIPYPIIALFPQDNVLGLESTCDIVVERAQKKEVTEIKEEIEAETISTINPEDPELIRNTLDYVLTLNGSIPKNSDLQIHVQQMLKNDTVTKYTDPDTGLKSVNHFVLASE
ncbi:MAG: hypothetical protein MJ179_10690 [Treponema sp.]|nr:hypothetical protein [Treponema sp.]